MPTFIADPPQIIYLLLGGLLIVTGLVAAQKQDRKSVTAFAIAFFLMLIVFLVDRFAESPREEAERRAYMMARAADAKNPDAFAEHVADKVTIANGNEKGKTITRDEVKSHPFWNLLRHSNVHVAVWDFSRDEAKIIGNTVEIGFFSKGEEPGGKQIPFYARATFTKQSDGKYKLTTLRTFDPIDHEKGFPIPGFP